MSARLKKSLIELRLNPARSALMILALILGLWGLGYNLVLYAILSNDLNENFTQTNPYHVVLTSEDFSSLNLPSFKSRDDIESAEFRDLSYHRIEVFPGQWIPMWIFGVENFENIELARIYREQGKKAPDPGTMLIERNGQQVSNLKLNSIAPVRIKGKKLAIPISGISFDPAQAPATQDAFIYSYVDKKTFREITGEPGNQRLIIRLKGVKSREDVRRLIQPIVEQFRADGIRLKTINIPKFVQHPHQFQLNTLITLQATIGFLALVLGVILVSQLMQAILAQQVRQIGILKAVGATRADVLGIYLTMVFVLGAVATLVAIPVAVASGYAYAGFVAGILNFNIITTTLPVSAYLSLLAAGLLLPILFTLPIVWRGVSISVREALSDYGINQRVSSSFAIGLGRLPISNALQLSFRNLFRNKKRIAITISMIALGVAIFSAGFNVRQSLVVFLDDTKNSLKYDVKVVLRKPTPPEEATAPFLSLSNLSHLETWSGGQGRLQSSVISASSGIGVVALPYDTDLMRWDVIDGRWLQPGDETEVVINQLAADEMGSPAVGEELVIGLKEKQVSARLVGIVKEFNPPKIYINKEQYDALVNPGRLINSLMFTAKNRGNDSVAGMKKTLKNH